MGYYLVAFQILVSIAYIGGIWRSYGVLPSISSSWYKLDKLSPLFTFFIWSLGVSTAVIGGAMEAPFLIASGGVLIFTGAAADYQSEEMTKWVHYAGAGFGIAFALTSLTISGVWLATVSFIVTSAISMMVPSIRKNALWWIEINAILHIDAGIIYQIATT